MRTILWVLQSLAAITSSNIMATILCLIFLSLAFIHFYWAFGGQWGKDAVIPTKKDNVKVLRPGALATCIVAVGMLFFGIMVLIAARGTSFELSFRLVTMAKYGLWIIAAVFLIRAIGDFKYVGFFKKYKQTEFGKNDTTYYSPLCVIIGLLAIMLALHK